MASEDKNDGLSPAGFKGGQGRTPQDVEDHAMFALVFVGIMVAAGAGIIVWALAGWVIALLRYLTGLIL